MSCFILNIYLDKSSIAFFTFFSLSPYILLYKDYNEYNYFISKKYRYQSTDKFLVRLLYI